MKVAKFIFLLLGLLLLAKVLSEADWQAIAANLAMVGWSGFAAVLGIHVVTFLTDVLGWQLMFTSVPLQPRWSARLYAVRLSGEAFNNILPAASVGGEPVKALLLKNHYGIAYRESTATLVLQKTVNMIALVVFLSVGFVMMLQSDAFARPFKTVAGVGLAVIVLGGLQFFLVQWFKLNSRIGRRLARTRFGQKIERGVHIIQDVEEHIVQFYRARHLRFVAALLLGFVNWVLGALEVYLVLGFIGHPVTFAQAWIVESLAQMMRAGAFFIPAAVGVQEGTFMIACRAITGVSETGVAMAVVRRCREFIWISLGLTLYWIFSMRRPAVPGMPEPAP